MSDLADTLTRFHSNKIEIYWPKGATTGCWQVLNSDPRQVLFQDGVFRIPTDKQLEEAVVRANLV